MPQIGQYIYTMNKAQQNACLRLWTRDSAVDKEQRSQSYCQFRRRFRAYPALGGPGIMFGGEVFGMFFGIEGDGYTHT